VTQLDGLMHAAVPCESTAVTGIEQLATNRS
jgi:hypothetical protein